MKIRTSLLLFVLTIAAAPLFAQFSVFGGPQYMSAKYGIRSTPQPTEKKLGFMGGVGLTTSLEGPLYFTPQLYYSQKGYKVTFNEPAFPPDSSAKDNDVFVHTLAFAPMFQWNLSQAKSHLFLRVGPAVSFNLSGTERFNTAGNRQVNRDLVFDFGTYSFATTSVNGQLGFQHKSGFQFFAHYEYGLSSLNNADLGPNIEHRLAGISVGYQFGQK